MIDTQLTGIGVGAIALMLAGWLWHTTSRWREAHDKRYEKMLVTATKSSASVELLIELYKDSRERHEKLLESNTRIATQVQYLTGMIESEKGTRARVNQDVTTQLREIRDRLPERRD